MTRTKNVTIDDLPRLTQAAGRYDLVRGELIATPPSVAWHGMTMARLTFKIADYVETHELGTSFGAGTGFIIDRNPDTLLAPDFTFVSAGRNPPRDSVYDFIEGPPDFAIEVITPSDLALDISDIVLVYLQAGTPLLWVMDIWQRYVTVYTSDRRATILTGDDILDGGDVLPGFRLPLSEIFR